MAISNANKDRINKMNSTAFKSQLGTVIQTAETNIASNSAALGGKSIIYCAQVTTAGGAADEDVTVTGALATDKCFVQLVDDGTNNVSVASAACDTDKVTVTFSGDPGNDAVVNVLVIR